MNKRKFIICFLNQVPQMYVIIKIRLYQSMFYCRSFSQGRETVKNGNIIYKIKELVGSEGQEIKIPPFYYTFMV